MWYVIQVRTGEEQKTKLMLDERLDHEYYKDCFIPLYECVRRRKDRCLIMIRRLFPGYIFIDTDYPVEVHKALKKIPDFTSLLGIRDDPDEEKVFVPVSSEDEEFLDSILENGIMRVSYVHLSKTNQIDKVFGPLEKYRKYITKMEYRHRYAVVEAEIFGKARKLSFGLWGDADPRLPWVEEIKARHDYVSGSEYRRRENDTGIYPGDHIAYPELYGDRIFTVDQVDPSRRTIHTTVEMFGCVRKIEMYVDDVRVVNDAM